MRSFLPAIQVNVPQEEIELDALFAQYLVHYRAAWRPFPDVVELLAMLRCQRVAIGVLTKGNHEQQLDKLVAIGLGRYIDFVGTSERIGFAKPDPRAFHALANALSVEPTELVFPRRQPRARYCRCTSRRSSRRLGSTRRPAPDRQAPIRPDCEAIAWTPRVPVCRTVSEALVHSRRAHRGLSECRDRRGDRTSRGLRSGRSHARRPRQRQLSRHRPDRHHH